jgi:hypothetical protein
MYYFTPLRFLWYSRPMTKFPPAEAPEAERVLLTVPPAEIAYFHAVLEGYDDLAVMRTLSPAEGLVEVYVSPGAGEEFRLLLAALRAEGVLLETLPGDPG